jgi:hypothetical protein
MARKRRAPNYTGALAEPICLEDFYKFTGGLGQAVREPDVAAISKQASKQWKRFGCCSSITRSIRTTSKAGRSWR